MNAAQTKIDAEKEAARIAAEKKRKEIAPLIIKLTDELIK